MPEATVSPRLNSIPCGHIPARLGQYRFSRNKPQVPLNYGFANTFHDRSIVSPAGAENVPLPSVEVIHRMAKLEEPSPVIIKASQLPREILAFADERVREDFKKYFDWVVFTPHLDKDDKWIAGFVVEEEGDAVERIGAEFWADAKIAYPLDRTMFINLLDSRGQELAAPHIQLIISYLLSQKAAKPQPTFPPAA